MFKSMYLRITRQGLFVASGLFSFKGWCILSGQKGSHGSLILRGLQRFSVQMLLSQVSLCRGLEGSGLSISNHEARLCGGSGWPSSASEVKGNCCLLRDHCFAPCSQTVWFVSLCGRERTFGENLWPKQKLWRGLLFLLPPHFLFSAWEPLQRVRCVGAASCAVIVKEFGNIIENKPLDRADLAKF